MNKKLLLTSVIAILLSTSTQASEKKVGTGPNPFSDCGIGAALFSESKGFAVTSNIIWDLGTTAITSATMSPETCSARNIKVAQFIINSYDVLNEDTARGEGEHLNTLLELANVPAENKQNVITKLRVNVAKSMGSFDAKTSETEKSQAYFSALVTAI